MDTIGKRIKYLRNEKRLTQGGLGDDLGFSKQIISNYENDLSKPSYDFLIKIFKIYNVNLNWFITGIGKPFNPPAFEDVEDELSQKVELLLKKHKLI